MKAIGDLLLILLITLSSLSCSTKKHVSKVEEQTQAMNVTNKGVRDSFAFELLIDTSSQCEQVISYERIEFYPQTYVCDSVNSHTFEGGNVCQRVKSHTRYTRNDSKQQAGKAKVVTQATHIDTSKVFMDSSSVAKSVTKDKATKVDRGLWWLMLVVLLLLAGAAYIRSRF